MILDTFATVDSMKRNVRRSVLNLGAFLWFLVALVQFGSLVNAGLAPSNNTKHALSIWSPRPSTSEHKQHVVGALEDNTATRLNDTDNLQQMVNPRSLLEIAPPAPMNRVF